MKQIVLGKPIKLEEEYKKPKINLFEIFQKTMKKEVPPSTLLVPIFQWCSNTRDNIVNMQKINEKFFFVNKDMLSRYLILNINPHRFIQYPKTKKIENKLDWFIPYIREYFDWAESDLKYNLEFLDLDDIELRKNIANHFGFDKSQRRKLGLKMEKIKLKKFVEKKEKQRRLF